MSESPDQHYILAVDAVALLGDGGERKLFLAAQAGKITLLGRIVRPGPVAPQGARQPIPQLYFSDAVVLNMQTNGFEGDGNREDFAAFERNVSFDRWEDVIAARPEIMALKNSLVSRESHSIAAETRCLAWLTEQMLADEQPQRAKAAYRADAKRQFGVGANGFNRAWATAVRDTGRAAWAKAGRKPQTKAAT